VIQQLRLEEGNPFMARMFRVAVMLAVLGGVLPAPRGFGQTPKPEATPPYSDGAANVLPGLPRPTDAPGSLFQKPSPVPPYSCEPLPGPYFEADPRLDPPPLPPPGWFAGLDLGIVGPHVKNRLTDFVTIDGRPPDTVHLPTAPLDWTVAPRVELGYRLLSGFGGFALAYRFFGTDGSESVLGPDGPANLRSRLDVNVVDWDYVSWEMSLWPNWGMKWWFGLRMANVYFDSQQNESFAAAAAGSGVFATRTTDHYLGWGPHYGLELTRQWDGTGLALVYRADGATLLGRTQQNFLEESTLLGPDGQLLSGKAHESNPQTVPIAYLFLSVRWQPPRFPNLNVSAGYEYEYWWNVARISTTTFSRGELSDQGVLLRAEFNY
jgi:hypothetical protein